MTSLNVQSVPRGSAASLLSDLLDSPEIAGLIEELKGLRWTGRPGYPIRSLVGACLAKSVYAIPTWSRTARLIAEHSALQHALGGCPSVYACYRFATKLRENRPALDACLTAVGKGLRKELPDYGVDVAIDASDLPAYANGERFLSKNGPERERYSDPEASSGHRSAEARRGEVALPARDAVQPFADRPARLLSRLRLDQGVPSAPARPSRLEAVGRPLPWT